MYKKFNFIILLIASLLINFSLFEQTLAADDNPESKPVEVATVKLQPFTKEITVPGSLRASEGIMVRPEIAGRITNLYFKSGDTVLAGTPLIQLNKEMIEATLNRSQAELKLAQQNYFRLNKLYNTHYVSKADFDNASEVLNAAKSQVAENQAQLNQTLIKAPFAGKLGLSLVNLGDYVNAGQDLVSLQAIDPIEVEFSVAEIYLGNLSTRQKVEITSDAYPKQIFVGTIYALNSMITPDNRTISARATLPNLGNKLLPGGFVQVKINLTDKTKALTIPQIAVIYDAGQTYVYKIVGDQAHKIKVVIGDRDRADVVVLNGLNANDVVVTAGQLNIKDGAKVKIMAGE